MVLHIHRKRTLRKFVFQLAFTFITLIITCYFLVMPFSYDSKESPEINLRLTSRDNKKIKYKYFDTDQSIFEHNVTVSKYYEWRMNWKTSKLGSILFKNEKYTIPKNKTFVVLIWKYWDWLKNRHINSFNSHGSNPLDGCSVKNCKFTGDDEQLDTADSVVVHIQHGLLPKTEKRNCKQRWIFLNDESPLHSFSMAKIKPKISDWANVFNWSMSYRSDADVPVPYGRTLPLKEPLLINLKYDTSTIALYIPNWEKKRRDVIATILISNCVSWRMDYIKMLQNYIDIDIYGSCSVANKDSCPGHFKADCELLSEYLFYLTFENSFCHQYMTEKVFQNAYAKGAIPVIMGPSLEDCQRLLPPKSYLHIDNFNSPQDLAKEMINISENDETLLAYHQWRNNFEIVNEHGYFGSKSYHYCRVCEALNYNDESLSVYDEDSLKSFLDPKLTCKTKN